MNEVESNLNATQVKSNSVLGMLEMIILATAAAGLLYFGYFQLAPWIWSQNLPFKPEEITPWILPWMGERDGIELYALYALMFINLFFALSLILGWSRHIKKASNYFLIFPLGLAAAFIYAIGFNPPMSVISNHSIKDIITQSIEILMAISPIIALLYYLQQHSGKWAIAIVALLLLPICFISTAPIEWYDYSFILAPALRLFNGAKFSETYFQYDIFLSLIGLAWMELKLNLNSFQVVAQSVYYLLLLSIFAFSRQWFLNKRLPIFLLAALVLVRIYAGPGDAIHSFQLTPLRLDMWPILLILVYFKGVHHWSVGLFCGLMLLLHKSFGIIYSAAYIQLLLTLCVMNAVIIPRKPIKSILLNFKTLINSSYLNIAAIFVGALLQYVLCNNESVQSDLSIVSLGIGFVKITTQSFYWYVLVILSLSFILLFKLRSKVTNNYLVTGFCLIYLSIGNSLYFFGRSHENNIINMSVILLVLFFFLIDIAGRTFFDSVYKSTSSFAHRNFSIIVAMAFIASIIIWYGETIADKVATQANNAAKGQFIYPSVVSEIDVLNDLSEVKSVTRNVSKVYFVGDNDLLLNYYGGYLPVGYFSPVYAWISKPAFNKFLQGLLDQGYYVVIDTGLIGEVLPFTKFTNRRSMQKFSVIWK
jgi:hypothetical protein